MIHNFDSTCSSSSLHSLIFGFQDFISIFFQSWEFGGLFKYTNVVLALWLFKANMEEEFGAAAGVVAVMGDSAAMGSSAAAASAMTLSESSDCTNPKEDVCAAAVIKSGNEGSGLLSSSPSCCWLILKTSDKHWAATSISSLSTPGAACTAIITETNNVAHTCNGHHTHAQREHPSYFRESSIPWTSSLLLIHMLLFFQVQKHNLSEHDSCCRNS